MLTCTLRILARIAVVAMLALASVGAHAAEDDTGAWAVFTTSGVIPSDQGDDRWRYWLDAQARFFDFGSGATQYLVRPGIGYSINDRLSVWAGYARFRSRNAAGDVSHEDRLWQQLSWSAARWQNASLSLRARLLQRSVSTGDDLGLILRLQAKYTRTLNAGSGTTLIASVEPFVDLRDTDWSGNAGLRQHRVFLGMGWRVSESLAMEAGYMNQYLWRDNASDRSNHLGLVNFKVSF